jgi:hypothetical protein
MTAPAGPRRRSSSPTDDLLPRSPRRPRDIRSNPQGSQRFGARVDGPVPGMTPRGEADRAVPLPWRAPVLSHAFVSAMTIRQPPFTARVGVPVDRGTGRVSQRPARGSSLAGGGHSHRDPRLPLGYAQPPWWQDGPAPFAAARRAHGSGGARVGRPNMTRRGLGGIAVVLTLLLAAYAVQRARQQSAPKPPWTRRWSDEFEGAAGARPDPARWSYDLGASGWGNAELQEYTDARQTRRSTTRPLA